MKLRIALLAATAALLPAMAQAQDASATAKMIDAEGQPVGTVTFNQTKSGLLHVFVEIANMQPGAHGFHIHETGQCDAVDGFKSAGGHLAGGKEHGVNVEGGPHVGDFPNVHAGQDGVIKAEFFSDRLTLSEGDNGLMDADGSAVMIHSGPDDYISQPAGDAGNRIACGVVEQPG